MENHCECYSFEKTFNDMVSFFLKSYSKFLKIKPKDLINKKLIKDMENDYKILKSLSQTMTPTGDECLKRMKKCSNNHSKQIEEIGIKNNKVDELEKNIDKYYSEIKSQIQEFDEEEKDEKDSKEDDIDIKEDELIDSNKINAINNNINDNNINKNNKINHNISDEYTIIDSNFITNNKPIEEMDDEEMLENGKKAIVLIENLLDDKEIKAKNNEEKRKIIYIKNQIKDIISNMEIEINKNDEEIDNIEENLENGFVLVAKSNNKNLEKAAKTSIERRKLEYQMKFAAAFGLAGTVIPSVSKILKGLLNYGEYKIDMHRFNQIKKREEKEQKMKEKEREKKEKKEKERMEKEKKEREKKEMKERKEKEKMEKKMKEKELKESMNKKYKNK